MYCLVSGNHNHSLELDTDNNSYQPY